MARSRPPAIGQLRNLATLYAWRDVTAAGGQAFPQYVRIGQAWVGDDPGRGYTLLSGGAQVDEVGGGAGTDLFTLRYRDDLTHEHLIEVKNRRYRIVRVLPDDRRRFLTLHCEAYGDADMIGVPGLPTDQPRWDDGRTRWGDGAAWG